ncbi:MAG: hypothetical protein ACKVW3_17750 [Phycisphaerales bacterium]
MTADLSPTAAARRDDILSLGLRTLRRRRIRRAAAHATLALAPVVAIAAVTYLFLPHANPTPAPTLPAVRSIAFVTDDPAALDRWAVPDSTPSTITIDDDSLRTLLAQAGLPAGIARAGNRVFTDLDFSPRGSPVDPPSLP